MAINTTQKQGEPCIIVNYFAFMEHKAYLLHFSYKPLYFAEVIIYAKWNRLIYALLSWSGWAICGHFITTLQCLKIKFSQWQQTLQFPLIIDAIHVIDDFRLTTINLKNIVSVRMK